MLGNLLHKQARPTLLGRSSIAWGIAPAAQGIPRHPPQHPAAPWRRHQRRVLGRHTARLSHSHSSETRPAAPAAALVAPLHQAAGLGDTAHEILCRRGIYQVALADTSQLVLFITPAAQPTHLLRRCPVQHQAGQPAWRAPPASAGTPAALAHAACSIQSLWGRAFKDISAAGTHARSPCGVQLAA